MSLLPMRFSENIDCYEQFFLWAMFKIKYSTVSVQYFNSKM